MMIERGKVLTASNGKYTIASLDRDGIVTPPISAAGTNDTYSVGDMVYYLIFSDGTGKILFAVGD